MTQEQKAKAYDEAIKVANKYKDTHIMFHQIKDEIFPELAESEDERIRKELLKHLKEGAEGYEPAGSIKEYVRWLAWLEKQGEHKSTLPVWKYKRDNSPLVMDSIILNKYGGVAKSPSGALVSNVWVLDFDELAKLPKEGIENQGEHESVDKVEPKFKVGDVMRTLQEAANGMTDGMPVIISIDEEYYHCTNELIAIKDQDDYEYPAKNIRQKPADKVEPKFHEGEWVVWDNKISCRVDNIYQGQNSLMYTITDTNNMTRSYSVKGFDNNAHLWTIKDAKDGDVLVYGDNPNDCHVEVIMIFKSLRSKHSAFTHFHIFDDEFRINDWCDCGENAHPATKEQRDQLEKAMTDAGYTFDFKKKELKKIEQKPAWSEEDERTKYNLEQIILSSGVTAEWANRLSNWLNSLKERITKNIQ